MKPLVSLQQHLHLLAVFLPCVIAQAGFPIDLYPNTNEIEPVDPDNMPLGPKREESDGPRDCAEILNENPLAPSGVYTIYPNNCVMCYYNVYCDMEQDGGGWTVISRRFNGSIDFYRGWYFYKMGFGNINEEYFLGLERIEQLTNLRANELKICLIDVGDVMTMAGYSHFYVGDEESAYKLHVDTYYGDAEDYLSSSNNTAFSTFDHDHDQAEGVNCAKYFHSAWWYHTYGVNCGSQSNLFGYYFLGRKELPKFAGPGISWKPVPGPGGPAVKEVIWKIRPMGYLGGSRDAGTFFPGGPNIIPKSANLRSNLIKSKQTARTRN